MRTNFVNTCTTGMSLFPHKMAANSARQLTESEKLKLQREEPISEFKREKLEKEARRNWDLFYKRNSDHFFKDRHWLAREFPELIQVLSDSKGDERTVLLEAGCGVGNAVFPLMEDYDHLFVYACDFSPRGVEYVKSNRRYDKTRCHVFECDLTCDKLTDVIPAESVHLVTLLFVLSAISPDKMAAVVSNLHSVLRPGGMVLLRDYGLFDHAMLRFGRGHKIQEQFYVRQDCTRAYYFSQEELWDLFIQCGFDPVENGYVQKETVNHKEGRSAARVFVQGKYLKRGGNPLTPSGCNSVEGESQNHGSIEGESQKHGSIETESQVSSSIKIEPIDMAASREGPKGTAASRESSKTE